MIINIIRNYVMAAGVDNLLGRVEVDNLRPVDQCKHEIRCAWRDFRNNQPAAGSLFINYLCNHYPQFTEVKAENEISIIL